MNGLIGINEVSRAAAKCFHNPTRVFSEIQRKTAACKLSPDEPLAMCFFIWQALAARAVSLMEHAREKWPTEIAIPAVTPVA